MIPANPALQHLHSVISENPIAAKPAPPVEKEPAAKEEAQELAAESTAESQKKPSKGFGG